MKALCLIVTFLLSALVPGSARAQNQTGNLYGTIVDPNGAVVAGATVTVNGPSGSREQTTNDGGVFQFQGLEPGSYTVKAEAQGFATFELEDARIYAGRNTDIHATLGSSGAAEGVTVTADEPPISSGQAVTGTELEKVPTARDPWAILQTTPGVLTDRINVGGNEADQQSQYVSPGQPADPQFTGNPMEALAKVLSGSDLFEPGTAQGVSGQQVDIYTYKDPTTGKDVTIMMGGGWDAALPPPDAPADALPPPPVPDGVTFDNFFLATPRDYISPFSSRGPAGDFIKPDVTAPGMQILAGNTPQGDQAVWSVDGVVITDMAALGSSPAYYDFDSFEEVQATTGGVVLDMVTKRGTNEWRGSGRYLISDQDWQATNQTFQQGNRIVTVEDYGAELGGPIIKDRLWLWGSYGTQEGDLRTFNDGTTDREWNYEKIVESAKILTVDADGNDATSPDFDPNNVVHYGFRPVCNITGFNVYALAGSEADADCGQVESSLRNMFRTGVFQGLINDPWAGIRRGPDPAAELEDTHIFSSNFYLTGLYSVVNGGFQLVPQGGTSAAIELDQELQDVNFYAGWVPTSSSAMGGPGQSPTIGPNRTRSFFVLQRSDFISCPGGAYLIKGNLGDPIDLGNGSSFQPFHNSFQLYQTERPQEQYKLDCSNFFNTGNLSHELKFGAAYRGAPQAEIGPTTGTWFYGGSAVKEEETTTDELVTGVEHALVPEFVVGLNLTYRQMTQLLDEPATLNPAFLNPFMVLSLDQNYGARFQGQQGGGEAQGEGGAAPLVIDVAHLAARAAETPTLYIEARGVSTGEAFTARVLGTDQPVVLEGAVALEPVAVPPSERARIEREVAQGASGPPIDVLGYCLNFAKQVPEAGTIYRIAGQEAQKAFEPLARVLEAAERVRQAGRLAADADPEGYFQFISQWAVWTKENGFDRDAFGDAFVEHVKRNVEQAGQRWTDEVEAEVRRNVPQRWRDIQQVLEEAGSEGDAAGEGS